MNQKVRRPNQSSMENEIIVSVIVSLTAPSALAFEWRSTWENTWGYSLMSPEERNDHERAVSTFKTMAECEAYIKHHNRVIQERIDNRQIKPKRPIPMDLCGQLKAGERAYVFTTPKTTHWSRCRKRTIRHVGPN